jgi:hypothetical protein
MPKHPQKLETMASTARAGGTSTQYIGNRLPSWPTSRQLLPEHISAFTATHFDLK